MKTLAIISLLILLPMAANSTGVCLREFTFDESNALAKWGKMVLNGSVKYTLMKEGEDGYVHALSDKACSALYYRVGYDLKDYPVLSWKWRVTKFPDLTNASTPKDRDDYAARVYVIFPFLNFSSSRFIEYLWSEDLPVGTIIDSPSGDNVKMIVIRSGKPESDAWISEKRNVHEDYLKAFGREPGLKAGAVAIMCDADSAKTQAESMFDEIMIEKVEGTQEEGAQK